MTDFVPIEGLYSAQRVDDEFNLSLFRAIHAVSPDGILVIDKNTAVVSYNQRFLDIWGIPNETLKEVLADSGALADNPLFMDLLSRIKDPDSALAQIHDIYETPDAEDHEELELQDGCVIERISIGLFNDEGDYLGRVWFFRDITKQRRTEKELREMAWHDPLTGALNRRHFLERAEEEFLRARRHERPVTLILADLDHFKSINDRFGHPGGDKVLEAVCENWQEALRASDLLCRMGGEEFAILLPDSDLGGAEVVAERLRDMLSARSVPYGNQCIHCTSSLGVTAVENGDETVHDTLARADSALYRAKRNGRNRVEVAVHS